MFPLRFPWTGHEDIKGLAVADVDGVVLKWVDVEELFIFVGDGELFGVLKEFKLAVDTEGVVEVVVFVNIGGLTDILVDSELFVSEETLDREEVEGCVKGLDTGGLLLQQGGKLAVAEEFDVVAVEELPAGFADAVADVLLLLFPDEALTVESCSWISIMWSPRRIVKFRGAFPERKSTT